DGELFERVKFLGDHGRDRHVPFRISAVGYKYKMSNLQAALGLAQLERIEEMVEKKRLIYHWYEARLGGVAGLRLNAERPWARGRRSYRGWHAVARGGPVAVGQAGNVPRGAAGGPRARRRRAGETVMENEHRAKVLAVRRELKEGSHAAALPVPLRGRAAGRL